MADVTLTVDGKPVRALAGSHRSAWMGTTWTPNPRFLDTMVNTNRYEIEFKRTGAEEGTRH